MQRSFLVFIGSVIFMSTQICWSADAEGRDLSQILALHEKVLQAHRANDVNMLMEDAADDYVLVTSGEVIYPTADERVLRFGEYFAITTFDKYEDSIAPVVKISNDGSLAWLIARVSVSAVQEVSGQEQALEFISAWIELYEKRDGRWIQTGNVSNFKP
ncbi:MAG: ketosteroid isomerase-like protein [Woeseiaceae bacterium]|jgi:ketosteroid isomerase-like protein